MHSDLNELTAQPDLHPVKPLKLLQAVELSACKNEDYGGGGGGGGWRCVRGSQRHTVILHPVPERLGVEKDTTSVLNGLWSSIIRVL